MTHEIDKVGDLQRDAADIKLALSKKLLEIEELYHNLQVSNEQLFKSRMQAELATVAKSEFLSNMSHEIRTPLNGIIGFTDILMQTTLDDAQMRYMKIVNQSGHALLEIINNILDLSKIESGKLELVLEKIDLPIFCAQALDTIRFQALQKNITLSLSLSEDLPSSIFADGMRLRQVLVNLIGNAVKFTKNGEIELSIKTISNSLPSANSEILLFSVRDTGVGIKPENQKKIFQAFSQEDSTVAAKYGGTGLGLSISIKLLALMDSQLRLISEVGKGSIFYFEAAFRTD
jgi:signal transduction histidine kinase